MKTDKAETIMKNQHDIVNSIPSNEKKEKIFENDEKLGQKTKGVTFNDRRAEKENIKKFQFQYKIERRSGEKSYIGSKRIHKNEENNQQVFKKSFSPSHIFPKEVNNDINAWVCQNLSCKNFKNSIDCPKCRLCGEEKPSSPQFVFFNFRQDYCKPQYYRGDKSQPRSNPFYKHNPETTRDKSSTRYYTNNGSINSRDERKEEFYKTPNSKVRDSNNKEFDHLKISPFANFQNKIRKSQTIKIIPSNTNTIFSEYPYEEIINAIKFLDSVKYNRKHLKQ